MFIFTQQKYLGFGEQSDLDFAISNLFFVIISASKWIVVRLTQSHAAFPITFAHGHDAIRRARAADGRPSNDEAICHTAHAAPSCQSGLHAATSIGHDGYEAAFWINARASTR